MGIMIDEAAFREDLIRRGCAETVNVEWPEARVSPEHHHDYTARGLVLDGEFEITTPEWTRRFGPGEVFEVPAGTPHIEKVGPSGTRIVSGRTYPQPVS